MVELDYSNWMHLHRLVDVDSMTIEVEFAVNLKFQLIVFQLVNDWHRLHLSSDGHNEQPTDVRIVFVV